MDEEGNDINNALDTSRKGMVWTAEANAIILREIKNRPYYYAIRATEYLNEHDNQSSSNHWHNYLKRHHAGSKWTAEEDAIILR